MSDENHTACTAADLESLVSDASLGTQAVPRLNTSVRITIHSVRKRLADADGISAKAAIDGLVKAGILKDDTTQEIGEIRYSQEKTQGEEETIITIDSLD